MAQELWVKPRTPLAPAKITLPACEQIGVNIHMRRLECFFTDSYFEEKSFVSNLEKAIAALLSEIPLLAGRIVLEDGKRKGVISDDPKVQVKIVKHAGISAKELDAKYWPPHALDPARYCLSVLPSSGVGAHVFGVQLNIIDGGIVMAFDFNHIVADGVSRSQIIGAFSHHLRIALNGEPHQPSGTIPPSGLDKTLASGTHPARPILEWPDWRQKPPASPDAMTREQLVAYYRGRMAQMSLSIWHIPPDKMENLRKFATEPGSKERPSRMACTAALLWRSVAKARGHSPDTVTSLLTPVQARGRVPEMPMSWFGNTIVYGKADATVAELEKVSMNELGRRIKASVEVWTAERIREYWGSVEDCKDLDAIEPNKNTDLGTQIELSSVADMKGAQFVSWGRGLTSRASRFPALALSDGYCVVWPRLASGGIEVFCYLSRETLKKLAADPDFRAYTEYRAANDIAIDTLIAENSPKTSVRARL